MSTGQIVGGVVGAVAGFFVGGPYGAAVGFAVGLAAGGLLDPPKGPTVQGPTIQDTAVQTSTYGVPIPRVYGTIGGAGNILWVENSQLKATVRKKKSSGGKGGGGSSATTKTVTYSATFILGLCEGPIVGVRRIWCSDKLIYNAGSSDLGTIIASNQNATGFRIYLGTDNQMPDPRYEADVGVGNAPALRGLAYIAFDDFQLADFSNTLQAAQFKVEVVNNASFAPLLAYDVVDTNNSTTSYFVIKGDDSEIARTMARIDSSTFPTKVKVHTTSGAIEKFLNLGTTGQTLFAEPKLAVGDLDHAFVLSGGSITTSRGVFSGFNYTLSATNFIVIYFGGKFLVTWAVSGANNNPVQLHPGLDAFGNSVGPIVTAPAREYISIAVSDDRIYALTGSQIITFDHDLVEISAVSFTSVYPLLASGTYISHDAGKLWILPTSDTHPSSKILQSYNPTTGAAIDQITINVPLTGVSGQGSPGILRNGIIYRMDTKIANAKIQVINVNSLTNNTVSLSSIIEAEVDLSTLLTDADIDTTALASTVRGYRVSGGALRAALEPLQGAFPFDIRESGYGLKCVPRGQASVQTIPEADLGATDADTPGDSILQSREMDSQLPARTVISYFDSAREYAISEQYAERLNTEAINRVDRDLPLVLTANEAAGVAEVLQFLPWLERTEAAIVLPPTYLALEPADVVTVTTTAATYELRLTEINYAPDGRLECKARPNRAALYTSNALGGEGVAPDGTIGLAGPSDYALLDIPVVDEGLQNAPGLSVAMTGFTTAWPGGVLFRSADSGQTWTDLQAFPFKGTFGTTSAPMPARSGSLLDRGSSLVVSLLSGTLESITESAMLNGANFAAYGANGRWEIIRFANATLNGDGTYTLSVFWRGDRGTEQYTGTHVTGDTFVLLDDPDNAFIGYPTALIGSPQTYRAITTGASIDSDSDETFTYAGVNLECYSGVHPKGVRDTSQNLTISWKRRTRVGGEWRDSVDASLGETTESYEVDIMQGAVIKRTIISTTSSVSYTAAQQITDFGSAQTSVLVRIYQLSSVVGRGYPLEATL